MGGAIFNKGANHVKSKNRIVKTVERYSLDTKSWDQLADLNLPRTAAGSCCHGDYIYLFYGFTNTKNMIGKVVDW